MADNPRTKAAILKTFEREAELLAVAQLDLLAQIEAQLRAVHHTMRRIERLRGGKFHVGQLLTNGERATYLVGLSRELDELDQQLLLEHRCCGQMQDTIKQMQQRLADVKEIATTLERSSDVEPPDEGGSLGA